MRSSYSPDLPSISLGRATTAAVAVVMTTGALAAFTTPAHGQSSAPAPAIRPMSYTRTTLPNGLVLIVSEDHSTPLVAIEVSYHVGSMEDRPGRSGYAHFFEHMMFEGSAHVAPSELEGTARSAGGDANGFTDPDRQYYEEVVPKNLLATMLWMEADRMGTLLSRLDQTRYNTERAVIENERLMQYENQPYAGGIGSL